MNEINYIFFFKVNCRGFIHPFLLMFFLFNLGFSRTSIFTQKGTGPLYWSTYEQQYNDDDSPSAPWTLNESVFQSNIDWVATNLKPVGYNMICTDGGKINCCYNQNGYPIKHDILWVHDYQYWKNYCTSKGLSLGIYWNPLWIPSAAVADPNIKIIGTTAAVSTITKPGDMFDGMYWVDVDQTVNAEKYVKGCVNYFKSMGVAYLRIDFLCTYETDPFNQNGGIIHGKTRYQTALRWISEAAGNDMEISLVMPNLYQNGDLNLLPNAESELLHGDMIRINTDCLHGGWNQFSVVNRAVWNKRFSQFDPTFDGLIYWSEYTGKNKLIMDGDFLRIHTFANDGEKQTAVSLNLMAGAPIAVADQYNTIGSNISFYTNTELLALNQQGFVGKPLKGGFGGISDNVNSQIWIGMMPNGSWIVGLFNRENSTQNRSINFLNDLCVPALATVRDLWTHSDLGAMDHYDALNIAPHSCKIIKVTPYSGDLFNSGFETRDISAWTEWHPAGQAQSFGVDNNNVHTGRYKLYFWNSASYSQSIHQIKTGLLNGLYSLEAWVKTYGNSPIICRMEAISGSTVNYTNIPITNAWQRINATIKVSNGTFDAGFYINSGGGSSMEIDDVRLKKISNGLPGAITRIFQK